MTAPVDLVARYLRPGTLQLGPSPPLSLYVHLPWCLAKCPYCDFNSHELASPPRGGEPGSGRPVAWLAAAETVLPEARYIDALIADLEAALPQVWGRLSVLYRHQSAASSV